MKKNASGSADTSFKFRCRTEDLELFRLAAEREGFGGKIATWLLYHARRQAKRRSRRKT